MMNTNYLQNLDKIISEEKKSREMIAASEIEK